MKREIITIDENKCDGCGACIPNCPEGAIQLIDGKARLISDLFCDGLGACLGHCPREAITIETREAVAYNEKAAMQNVVTGGVNVIIAHLKHLHSHGESEYLREALEYLKENGHAKTAENFEAGILKKIRTGDFLKIRAQSAPASSTLKNWPVQLHLISPASGFFRNADLLLAADCVGFACPDFHNNHLAGKVLAIACPKLDTNKHIYHEKLTEMINNAGLQSITVLIMEVPCCSGLYALAKNAVEASGRDISLHVKIISTKGEILREF